MKVSFLNILFCATIVSSGIIGCRNSPKEKEDDLNAAKNEVVDAKANLVKSRLDSINDFNKYKTSIEKKLAENEKVIADLKNKNTSKGQFTQADYNKQLGKLELRNSELKSKIENYKQGPEQRWELFQVDFNKDVDDLGKSISSLAERNMKK